MSRYSDEILEKYSNVQRKVIYFYLYFFNVCVNNNKYFVYKKQFNLKCACALCYIFFKVSNKTKSIQARLVIDQVMSIERTIHFITDWFILQ